MKIVIQFPIIAVDFHNVEWPLHTVCSLRYKVFCFYCIIREVLFPSGTQFSQFKNIRSFSTKAHIMETFLLSSYILMHIEKHNKSGIALFILILIETLLVIDLPYLVGVAVPLTYHKTYPYVVILLILLEVLKYSIFVLFNYDKYYKRAMESRKQWQATERVGAYAPCARHVTFPCHQIIQIIKTTRSISFSHG